MQNVVRKYWHFLILLVILLLAFLFRTQKAKSIIFTGDDIQLLGVDPYFYLRHAEYANKNFPNLQKFDFGTHYPIGTPGDAAGLFPLAIATVARFISFGEADAETIATVSAYVPPVIILGVIVLIFLIALKLGNSFMAVAAILLFLLYPGNSLPRSVLGFTDHHILEIFFSLWVVYAWIMMLETAHPRKWIPHILSGLPLALMFCVWPGAPLYLLILGVVILFSLAGGVIHGKNRQVATAVYKLCLGSMSILVLVFLLFPSLLVVSKHDLLTKVFPGFIFLAGSPFVFNYLFEHTFIQVPAKIKATSTILLVGLSLWLFFTYTGLGSEVWFWLNFRYAGLIENRKVDRAFFFSLYNLYGYLALLSPFVVLYFVSGKTGSVSYISIPVFTLFFLGFWYNTYDLDYMPPAYLSLCLPLAVWMIFYRTYSLAKKKKKKSKKTTSKAKWPSFSIVALSVVICILPLFSKDYFKPYLDEPYLVSGKFYEPALYETTDWLREHTPPPSLEIDQYIKKSEFVRDNDMSYPKGTYGVISAWDYGNLIAERGRRIPVWSRWPAPAATGWMYAQSEAASLDALCPKCDENEEVKFAVVDANMAGKWFVPKLELAGLMHSDYVESREVQMDGQNVQLLDLNRNYYSSMLNQLHRNDAIGMSHYRLVYESTQKSFTGVIMNPETAFLNNMTIDNQEELNEVQRVMNGGFIRTNNGILHNGYVTASAKVFEIVKGAEIIGRAEPGSRVRISLPLFMKKSQRRFTYRQETNANANSQFTFTLPYSNSNPENLDVQALEEYLIQIFDPAGKQISEFSFSISERDVQGGATKIIDN